MDYIDILQEMLRYIDTHIKGKLSVEKLAARAGFSPYHFCRIFHWGVGYPIMEYVRNRRLAFAASELNSGKRVIDIALEYGFETHSGFTKAFRRRFGSPPEIYRRHASFDIPKLPVLEKTKQYTTGGIVMEPKMVKMSAKKIAGFALKTKNVDGEDNNEIDLFWDEYSTGGKKEKIHGEAFVKDHAEYGACFQMNHENGEFEYVIGLEVKDGHDVPKGYHVRTIPEALYAVFSLPPASEENFLGTYHFIYSEWLPASGYELGGNGVDFELNDGTGNVCEYIPVVKKAS